MEAVGFATSILTLASAALQSTRVIYEFIENCGDHPESLENLAKGTRQLSSIIPYLTNLQTSDRFNDFASPHVSNTFQLELKNLLEDCVKDLSQIERIITQLQVSDVNALRRAQRSWRLLLSDRKFDEAWKRIHLYAQIFTTFLTRAGINNAQIESAAILTNTQDHATRMSGDLFKSFGDIQAQLRHSQSTFTNDIISLHTELHMMNTQLGGIRASQIAEYDRRSQQIQHMETQLLSTGQQYHQIQTSDHADILMKLDSIQDRLKSITSESLGPNTKLDLILDGIRGLEISLRPTLPQAGPSISSLEPAIGGQTRPEASTSSVTEIRHTSSSLQRLLELNQECQEENHLPSLASVMSDLMTVLQELLIHANVSHHCTSCQRVERSMIAQLMAMFEGSRFSQRIRTVPHSHSPMVSERRVSEDRESNGPLTVSYRSGIRGTDAPSPQKRKFDLLTAENSTDVTPVNKETAMAQPVGVMNQLRNRRTTATFDLAETPPVKRRAASTELSLSQRNSQMIPSLRLLRFNLEGARVDLLVKIKQRSRSDIDQSDECQEVTTASVVFTPHRWADVQVQTTVQCSQITTSYGQQLPGPTFLSFTCVRNSQDWIFDAVKKGLLTEVTQAFEKKEAHPTDVDELGCSLLSYAFEATQPQMAHLLLEKGADVNRMQINGTFHEFCDCWGYCECFATITANAFLSMYHGKLIGDNARSSQHYFSCFKIALEHEGDVEFPDHSSSSFVNELLKEAPTDWVRAVLDSEHTWVSCNKMPGCDVSPLMTLAEDLFSSFSGNIQLPDKLALLLSRGAEIHVRDELGYTCLHTIFMGKQDRPRMRQNNVCPHHDGELIDMLIMMITAGADVCAVSNGGISVTDVAFGQGYELEWVEALEHCGFDSRDVLDRENSHNQGGGCSTSAHDEAQSKQQKPPFLTLKQYLKERESRRYFCECHNQSEYWSKTDCQQCGPINWLRHNGWFSICSRGYVDWSDEQQSEEEGLDENSDEWNQDWDQDESEEDDKDQREHTEQRFKQD